MVDSIGKHLKQARLGKGLSIGDAARATKIRPARIEDLEKDEYSNFPNLVYARGFVSIYANFLGVDVSDYLATFGPASGIGLDGYQYLEKSSAMREGATRPKPVKLPPLLIAALALVVLLVVAGCWWFISTSLNRLHSPASTSARPVESGNHLGEVQSIVAPERSAGPKPATLPTPPPRPPEETFRAIEPIPASPPDDDRFDPDREVRRAIAVAEVNPVTSKPHADAPGIELEVRPVRQTWVKIIQDDINAPPVFEDWLRPNSAPIALTGRKFWLTILDAGAVEIRRNGEPVPYEGTAIMLE